jgi:exopolysaccharide production protein ExoY
MTTKMQASDNAHQSAAPWIAAGLRRCGQYLYHFVEDSLRRDVDFIGALCILVLTSPILILTALLVVSDGGPILFAHRRVGLNGVSFGCWKFRTMMVGAEECLAEYLRYHPDALAEWTRAQKLRVDPRITSIGGWLRNASLDEIPQMWNVVVGQMSLVGPRPVTEREMKDRYGPNADLVTSVKPGVTGPWQITRNRNDMDYSDRVQLDVRYVNSRNIATDIGILLQTITVVLWRRDCLE